MPSSGIIKTKIGDFEFELYDKDTPNTVKNFVELAQAGFYSSSIFHRVIPSFVIQGGCPKKDGTGSPGYKIPCETENSKQHHDTGVLSMAHAGKDTGGSQFFIVLSKEQTGHLNGNHTCFGKIKTNVEMLRKINQNDNFSIEILNVDQNIAKIKLNKL